MTVHPSSPTVSELGAKAHKLYERIRPEVETPDNIGKFIVLEVESGDYEIDEQGIESSHRLQSRHPDAVLYALRIGYKTAVSFCGGLERITTGCLALSCVFTLCFLSFFACRLSVII